MTVVPVTSADLDAAEVSLVLGALLGRLRVSRRAGRRGCGPRWAHCSRHREDGRGAGVSQHPVPVLLSGRSGHAELRRRLRAADRPDQHAGRRALRRDAADHAGAHHRHARPHAGRAADGEHHLVAIFPGRRSRQHLPLPALARGGGDPEAGLDAGRDQLSRRGLRFQRAHHRSGAAPTRPAGRCSISAAIRPTRWNCAASIATST